MQLITKAQESVIIISPWINAQAVDREFLRMLQAAALRSVVTVIGWGIADHEAIQDRPTSPELLRTLGEIRDNQGRQAVIVWWLGKQHRKTLIVDRQTMLSGSHNFLSYRGDFNVRGEEAFEVRVADAVADARSQIRPLFESAVRIKVAEAAGAAKPIVADYTAALRTLFVTSGSDVAFELVESVFSRQMFSPLDLRAFASDFLALANHPWRVGDVEPAVIAHVTKLRDDAQSAMMAGTKPTASMPQIAALPSAQPPDAPAMAASAPTSATPPVSSQSLAEKLKSLGNRLRGHG